MMTSADEQRLRRAGYRVTRQRTAVFERLRSTDSHPTAETLHRMVRHEIPQISLATVYNAVDSLVEVGLARKLESSSSSARYDADTGDHGHFRCFSCDDVWDVSVDTMPVAPSELDNYEVVDVSVVFAGYCPACRREKLGLPRRSAPSSS